MPVMLSILSFNMYLFTIHCKKSCLLLIVSHFNLQKKENFSIILHRTTDEAIELFKATTSLKIKKNNYSAENLMNGVLNINRP